MQTILVFAELVIAVALIIFVLLQRSEGGALGMGGGGGGGMGGLFSPRGAADTLTRTTAILAASVLPHLPGAQPAGAAWPQRDIDSRCAGEQSGVPRPSPRLRRPVAASRSLGAEAAVAALFAPKFARLQAAENFFIFSA